MTLTQAVSSAIWTLQFCCTEEDADRILNLARSRGADEATCNALRREWQELYAKTVQVIGGGEVA